MVLVELQIGRQFVYTSFLCIAAERDLALKMGPVVKILGEAIKTGGILKIND